MAASIVPPFYLNGKSGGAGRRAKSTEASTHISATTRLAVEVARLVKCQPPEIRRTGLEVINYSFRPALRGRAQLEDSSLVIRTAGICGALEIASCVNGEPAVRGGSVVPALEVVDDSAPSSPMWSSSARRERPAHVLRTAKFRKGVFGMQKSQTGVQLQVLS
jgi:hypothetical protein